MSTTGCTGHGVKIGYATAGEARLVVRNMSRRGASRGFSVYQCGVCGLWCLGSKAGRKQARRLRTVNAGTRRTMGS